MNSFPYLRAAAVAKASRGGKSLAAQTHREMSIEEAMSVDRITVDYRVTVTDHGDSIISRWRSRAAKPHMTVNIVNIRERPAR